MSWDKLVNSAAGKTAYVVGKGPTLDNWAADKFPREPDSVIIGVNQVGNVAPVDYTFTTDGPNVLSKQPGKVFIGLPYQKGKFQKSKTQDWFLHCHDIRREGTALRQTKEQLTETRWLYTASSSVQPAIHFAWYIGCEKLVLVGIGGAGYSRQFPSDPGKNTDTVYHMLYQDTKQAANYLFGKRWDHMYDITTQRNDS